MLEALIKAGHVRIEREAIIGIASDGVEVALGSTDNVEACERYLADFPTPEDW